MPHGHIQTIIVASDSTRASSPPPPPPPPAPASKKSVHGRIAKKSVSQISSPSQTEGILPNALKPSLDVGCSPSPSPCNDVSPTIEKSDVSRLSSDYSSLEERKPAENTKTTLNEGVDRGGVENEVGAVVKEKLTENRKAMTSTTTSSPSTTACTPGDNRFFVLDAIVSS